MVTTLGHGSGGLAFLDGASLVYAAGCGVVVHDTDSGVQVDDGVGRGIVAYKYLSLLLRGPGGPYMYPSA